MRFKAILVDPPVPYNTYSGPALPTRRLRQASAASHYELMTWQDIHALGDYIDRVADEDCALFLWACNPHIPEYIKLLESWRFVFKTVAFVWVKLNPKNLMPFSGLGYWTRSNSESLWLATRGSPTRLARDVKQVQELLEHTEMTTFREKRGRHSEKPERFQDEIERLINGPYLELFARRKRPGWTCIGNEVDGRDIRDALNEIAAMDMDEEPLETHEMLKSDKQLVLL
jgi:N6-adenosine-specific RNA methylase IME4